MSNPNHHHAPPPGWTREARARFLKGLAASGDVRRSAQACRLSRQSVYRLRQRDASFAKAWDEALAAHRADLERGRMQALARLSERRNLRGLSPAEARFLDLVAQILGEPERAGEGAANLPPGHRHSCQFVSTGHFTQSSPICS